MRRFSIILAFFAGAAFHAAGRSFIPTRTTAAEPKALASSTGCDNRLHAWPVRVVDGDTIHVAVYRGRGIHSYDTIRLLGVDAPERDTKEGRESKARLEELVKDAGEALHVRWDRDQCDSFGRWLVTLHDEQKDLGATLIKEGLATAWKR